MFLVIALIVNVLLLIGDIAFIIIYKPGGNLPIYTTSALTGGVVGFIGIMIIERLNKRG